LSFQCEKIEILPVCNTLYLKHGAKENEGSFASQSEGYCEGLANVPECGWIPM